MKMKLFFYISSLILLTCFSACKRSAYPPVMQQAEALMETRPDSALYLLEGMADTLAMLSDKPGCIGTSSPFKQRTSNTLPIPTIRLSTVSWSFTKMTVMMNG